SNLLTNATKFVPPGVKPVIQIWSEPVSPASAEPSHPRNLPPESPTTPARFVRIYFQDNGIGIAEKDLQRIFGMFERVHAHTAYEGTGIGLAIVKKAVERMGGQVGVES